MKNKVHLVIKSSPYTGKQEFLIFSKYEKAAEYCDNLAATQSKEDWVDTEIESIKVDQEC